MKTLLCENSLRKLFIDGTTFIQIDKTNGDVFTFDFKEHPLCIMNELYYLFEYSHNEKEKE